MEPEQIAAIAAAMRAQEAAQRDAERRIVALTLGASRGFTGWYDSARITAWARLLASRVEPIQRVLARSTSAYVARVASISTGRSVRPESTIDPASLRTGVSHSGAYARAADQFRYQESRLKDPASAGRLIDPQQAAMNRVEAVAVMDAQLPVRAQAKKSMETQRRIVGYRRVIHPELSAGGVCGLCVAASDRMYYVADLMPIHEKCKCIPMPVYAGKDPGSVLNQEGLALYEDAGGSTSAAALKRTRYKVVQHSELGPMLVRTDAEVRTAADVKRDERS